MYDNNCEESARNYPSSDIAEHMDSFDNKPNNPAEERDTVEQTDVLPSTSTNSINISLDSSSLNSTVLTDSHEERQLNHVNKKESFENDSGIESREEKLQTSEIFNKLQASSNHKNRQYRKRSDDNDMLYDEDDHSNQTEEATHENSQVPADDTNETSSSSTDSSIDLMDIHPCNDIQSSDSEDDVDEAPAILQKKPSKPNCFIVTDIINRELGLRCCNNLFENRFYSSLYTIKRLQRIKRLEEHRGCVNTLNFNRCGKLLASSSDDLKLIIWDWAIDKKCNVFQTGHKSNVLHLKWLPLNEENFIVTCARDGQIRLMDINSDGYTRKIASHKSSCHRFATHPDIPFNVISAGGDSRILFSDIRDNKPTKLTSVAEIQLYSIHCNPLNSYEFCVSGQCNNVKIYDRRKATNPLYTLCPKHIKEDTMTDVLSCLYNYNGTEILASYNNDDIYLFDIPSGKNGEYAHKYQGHKNGATIKSVNFFGPKSEYVVSGSDCGNIFIWDKKTEAIVQWMEGDEQGVVNVLEPHPFIPLLATSGLDHDVKLWMPSRNEEELINNESNLKECVKSNLRSKFSAYDPNDPYGNAFWQMLSARQSLRYPQNLFLRIGSFSSNESSNDELELDTSESGASSGDSSSSSEAIEFESDSEN